jgi:Na+/melibiose symporter-like transporter
VSEQRLGHVLRGHVHERVQGLLNRILRQPIHIPVIHPPPPSPQSLWNALNDPLFGWISDTASNKSLRRTIALRRGGLAWAAIFALVWHAPTSSPTLAALHCLLALCLYDGCLTYVDLNHAALIPDLCASVPERLALQKAGAVGAIVGAGSSFFAAAVWDEQRLWPFRVFSLALAAVCGGAFYAASLLLHESKRSEAKVVEKSASKAVALTPRVFFHQIARQRNFVIFLLVSAVQVFECTFEKNFLALFVASLLPSAPLTVRSGLVSAAYFLPHFSTIALSGPIDKYGVYAVRAARPPLTLGRSSCPSSF